MKADRAGRLTYRRQIPVELRPYLGNRASIRTTLETAGTDPADPAVLAAYSRVHTEVEAEIQRAKQQLAQGSALMAVDTAVVRPGLERFPLSKRDIAGIGGQVLLDIREAVAHQQDAPPELAKALRALTLKVRSVGISGTSVADFAVLARPALHSLGIDPTPGDMQAIGEALLGYFPVIQADMAKLQQMDYSPPRLAEVAPPSPKRQPTWEELFKAWLRSTGGVLEKDGYGVSERRYSKYHLAIAEFRQHINLNNPNELTTADARRYMRWLQEESDIAITTQQGRMSCLRNLMRVGVHEGLISGNPFADVVLKTPAGAEDVRGYRPYTKPELIKIFGALKEEPDPARRLMPWILLCTGCRAAEATQLRTKDIKQTEKGTWFIDWRHEPTDRYPMMLKSKGKNNRQCPIHSRLIEEGLLDLPRDKEGLLLPGPVLSTSTWTMWFKRLLVAVEVYELRKTGLHSLRGTAKDLWREAGISLDHRNALTGHTSTDKGESSYGVGLRMMPDVLHVELNKLDLSWLP